jgi:hypothetical protein
MIRGSQVANGSGLKTRTVEVRRFESCPRNVVSRHTQVVNGRRLRAVGAGPAQVRILVAACRSHDRHTIPCVSRRRTQVDNGKRLRTAGVGPTEVRILAATCLSVVQRPRRLPVEEETHVRVVPERLGAVEEPGIRALTEFSPASRCDGERSFVSPVMRPRRFESCPPLWPMTLRARSALQWSSGQTHGPLTVEPPVQIRAGAFTYNIGSFIASCGIG